MATTATSSNINVHVDGRRRQRGGHRTTTGRNGKPKLTHFLSIPLGHHPALRDTISKFSSSLLSSEPPVDGLDTSIVISPRRLHLTLGVMSLKDVEETPSSPKPTVASAMALLQNLRPLLLQKLGGSPLVIPLECIDILKPGNGRERKGDKEGGMGGLDPMNAHVLFAGPSPSSDSEEVRRLKDICNLIRTEFTRAGRLIDEARPLKLHVTLINTIYRRASAGASTASSSKRNKSRTPFSFGQVLASEAFRAISAGAHSDGTIASTVHSQDAPHADDSQPPYHASLGAHPVDRVEVCVMGSKDAEGAYVSVGGISLLSC